MRIKKADKIKIQSLLSRMYFVQWDRYIEAVQDDRNILYIYGWIPRTKDAYKDFIVFRFDLTADRLGYCTSSIMWHNAIVRRLGLPASQPKCKRVEDAFDIKNSIKLRGKL